MSDKSGFAEQMPATIGRYQVQESIGFGAMGAVYKAFDPLIKRTLAIKTIRLDIPRQSPQYRSFIERFYHEARISGTLSHPNIVTLFDIGEEGGVPYLAMEFVEGETISSVIDRGVRFPPEKVIALVSQVASAMDYAHGKGVIHRDIKPSNLILFDAERVKVTDFGIAKLVDAEMTQSGTLLGTPSYMSPEQAMGERLDGRSDIFSLGVCAFEMLSGEQPFPGTNVTSILYKLVHVDPIEPANLEMNGLVPQKWHDVFGRVLAKKPDDRYQTGGAFVQDLEYCLGSWFGAAVGDETVLDTPATVITGAAVPKPVSGPAATPKPASQPPAAPPPVSPPEEITAAIPRVAVPPPPPPAARRPPAPPAMPPSKAPPPAAGTPTVLMKAPPLDESGPTVRVKAPSIPPPPAKAPPVSPPTPTTVRAPIPTAALPSIPLAKPAPAPKPAPPRAPAPSRSGVPVGWLLAGGVALLFVIVFVVGAAVFLRSRGEATASPEPNAAATPPPAVSTAPPAAPPGALSIETQPPGAAISVNGEPKGVSPLELADLAVGNYQVSAELRGYESQTQTATITAEAPHVDVRVTLSRQAPTTGSAEIVSTPAGADVSVDGKASGQTPVADLKLRPGAHKVDLTRDGYEPWTGSVSVEAGKKARLEAALKAIPKAATPPPKPQVDANHVYENSASEVDTPAKRVSGSSAEYPRKGVPNLRSGQSVSVSLTFMVNAAGDVEDIQVVESAGKVIDEAVMSAVRQWKYSPAEKGGEKVKVRVRFKQTFQAG
jgi:TonB family protein